MLIRNTRSATVPLLRRVRSTATCILRCQATLPRVKVARRTSTTASLGKRHLRPHHPMLSTFRRGTITIETRGPPRRTVSLPSNRRTSRQPGRTPNLGTRHHTLLSRRLHLLLPAAAIPAMHLGPLGRLGPQERRAITRQGRRSTISIRTDLLRLCDETRIINPPAYLALTPPKHHRPPNMCPRLGIRHTPSRTEGLRAGNPPCRLSNRINPVLLRPSHTTSSSRLRTGPRNLHTSQSRLPATDRTTAPSMVRRISNHRRHVLWWRKV